MPSARAVSQSGPFQVGDRVQLTDPKGRMHTITLSVADAFHTAKGAIEHDDILGQPEGIVVQSSNGTGYLAQRPLLKDFVLSMPRGATVIYPKDSSLIVGMADIYPGARVIEAGAGSGAMSCSLLRAVGADGTVHSFERRSEFAEVADKNVTAFFGKQPDNWALTVGDLSSAELAEDCADRMVLDMVAPWECIPIAAHAIRPGGVLCVYVATTTQLSRTMETLRHVGGWTEPEALETLLRTWHVEGLAVRPDHRMGGHTGFLVFARRLAPDTELPPRTRRPAPGAYGDDWRPWPMPGEPGFGTTDDESSPSR